MIGRAVILASALLLIGGCAHDPAVADRADSWQRMAMDGDRERLRNWHQAWDEALPLARRQNPREIAAGGALFDPDRAYPGAVPPPGQYRCRVFKLGAKGTAMADFTTYPDFACSVTRRDGRIFLTKLDGAQRPSGILFPESASRATFLGTLAVGDETGQIDYGRDAQRDLAGYVERIGERRWRLVLPYPRIESILDVVELVPAR